MPKGSKAWPIETARVSTTRSQIITLGIAFSLGPLIILIAGIFRKDFRAAVPVAAAIFLVPIVGCIASFVVIAGRSRFTPTSVLWCPKFGKPRWVQLSNAKRFLKKGDLFVYDVGKRTAIPKPFGRQANLNASQKSLVEMVDSWNSGIFKPFEPAPLGELILMIISSAVGLISLFLWLHLLRFHDFLVLKFVAAKLAHHGIRPPFLVVKTALLTSLVIPIAAIWAVSLTIAAVCGFGNIWAPRWRYRHNEWQGFDAESGIAIEPPAIPL